LADELTEREDVTLRVSGFDRELARLEFLRWFPRLRRLSISGLHYATDLSLLRYLPEDLEFLDLGETKGSLDLAPALRFRRITEFRVVGHRKRLRDVVIQSAELRGLSIWRLPADKLLSDVTPPHLESLAVTLGSIRNPQWLAEQENLRYLALRAVKGLGNLDILKSLRFLEWLWLDGLSAVEMMPDLSSSTRLLRVDLTEMRGLRAPDALEGVARAPRLQELLVSESHLPVGAFRSFERHPQLKRVGVGLGSERRNSDVESMLSRPPQRPLQEFTEEHKIMFMK
jgi:hypothetical protein